MILTFLTTVIAIIVAIVLGQILYGLKAKRNQKNGKRPSKVIPEGINNRQISKECRFSNDQVSNILNNIVTTYGISICDDPKRCEALLKDLCPDSGREIFVLVNALREKVGSDLLSSSALKTPLEVLLAQLSRRLQRNLGLTEEISQWAVETWAIALGVRIIR